MSFLWTQHYYVGHLSSRLPTALYLKLPGGAYKVKTSYIADTIFYTFIYNLGYVFLSSDLDD